MTAKISCTFYCPWILLGEEWHQDVCLVIDDQGIITEIQKNTMDASAERLEGPVIPGMANVHSHAFQRAMLGLNQKASLGADSFWTWRRIMYQFVEGITPEIVEANAAMLYMEMLKNGYTSVGEFHYLHHDRKGIHYSNRAEMSERIFSAAKDAGIGLTHLPVLYRWSGFGQQEALQQQSRFTHSIDDYVSLLQHCFEKTQGNPLIQVGIAPHSLRAVSNDDITKIIEALDELDSQAPIHIHIAEQIKEVEDCKAWCGQRPVQHLLSTQALNQRWCLVHATHLEKTELNDLASSGSVVGVCPSTEADLGDGIFPAQDYIEQQGAIAIGSDSHVCISPCEELKLFEYAQRLRHGARNIIRLPGQTSTGISLYSAALTGAQSIMHQAIGSIDIGIRADLVVLDSSHYLLAGKQAQDLLDTYLFSGGKDMISSVFVGGKRMVNKGQHIHQEAIRSAYYRHLVPFIQGL